MQKHKKAFTLVELIVVITILAILGTIAFISLQGYSKDARDSVRISDISKIKTSLELFQLDAGKYPDTTTPTNITYSGAIAWTQGTFGEATFNNVTKLDKIPLDPVTDRQYVYSVTNTKQEYQLAGIMEGDEVSYNPLAPLSGGIATLVKETNAAGKTAMVKISGNFNGKLLKVSTGSIDYILAMPSIITSSGITVENIVSNNLLAYNGYKNLPAQYTGSSYDVLGDTGITLINSADLVVYSGDLKTLSDTTSTGINSRKSLITNLQKAYSGTNIASIGEIAQIISTQINDTKATELLSSTIVNNDLGGSIAINLGIPVQFLSNCTASGQIYYTDNSGNKLATVTNTGSATWESGKSISDLTCAGHIIMCSGNNAGYILQTCNQGSLTVGTDISSYGNWYQFGKSDTSWVNGTVGMYNDWKEPGGTNSGSANDWGVLEVNKTTATWSNSDDTSRVKMQGPCATGYHVPTKAEWVATVDVGGWGTTLGTNMRNTLKLPFSGFLDWNSGIITLQASYCYYWTSSPNGNYGNFLYFHSTSIFPNGVNNRSYGLSVRCFKN